MYYLVYLSSATKLLTREKLIAILQQSRVRNKALAVTGLLLYMDGSILQILEGDKETVAKLYNTIAQDTRHQSIVKILQGTTDKRNFPDWQMGFQALSPDDYQEEQGYFDIGNTNFLEENLNTSQINHPILIFLQSFYNGNRNR